MLTIAERLERVQEHVFNLRADLEAIAKSHAALQAACDAALRYDAAIKACADDPTRMATFCTATGENLDLLYGTWIDAARTAIAQAKDEKEEESE